jgi:hypothetical protein
MTTLLVIGKLYKIISENQPPKPEQMMSDPEITYTCVIFIQGLIKK